MKLAIRDSGGDWYVIERAEHDNKAWMQPTSYGAAFMHSARFSDADVEGTADEMLAIAKGIETREGASFKRCAVEIQGDRALFSSPRNSTTEGVVTLAEADDLAKQIRALLEAPRAS